MKNILIALMVAALASPVLAVEAKKPPTKAEVKKPEAKKKDLGDKKPTPKKKKSEAK
jgi:hypothetical protein